MTSDVQTQQNDMEVRFSSERLRTTATHSIKRDMYQTHVYALDIRITETGCAKVAGQELHESKVGSNQVIDLLLAVG